jgi:hypothetical protein
MGRDSFVYKNFGIFITSDYWFQAFKAILTKIFDNNPQQENYFTLGPADTQTCAYMCIYVHVTEKSFMKQWLILQHGVHIFSFVLFHLKVLVMNY